MMRRFRPAILPLALVALIGCDDKKIPVEVKTAATISASEGDEVAAVRAKLDPADRVMVDAQEWCAIQTEERLGSMGPPSKLDIEGQTVFVCCKSCERKAKAHPDATLAKVAELKAKKLEEKK